MISSMAQAIAAVRLADYLVELGAAPRPQGHVATRHTVARAWLQPRSVVIATPPPIFRFGRVSPLGRSARPRGALCVCLLINEKQHLHPPERCSLRSR